MRLVLDVEWETGYIEVTAAEAKLLDWPARRTESELREEAALFLAGKLSIDELNREPDGYRQLAACAYALVREARAAGAHHWRDASRGDGPWLLGFPARIVDGS